MDLYAKILEGLNIFAKYKGPSMQPEHDELHAGAEEPVSDEDAARLEELGWSKQEETWWSRYT